MQRSKSSSIEDVLRERIMLREILPGTKLKEMVLAEEFGVSRTRIRQALSVLEARGLVERIPNQGALVSVLDAASLFKIYDVFEMLEGLCVRLAVQNAPPESWSDLIEVFGPDLEKEISDGNCEKMYQAVKAYRTRVIDAADNPTLRDVLTGIWDKTEFMIRRTLILPGRAEQSFKDHVQIVAAMQSGDAYEAERLKFGSMRRAREVLEKYQQFVL